jgi:hypothetical protein
MKRLLLMATAFAVCLVAPLTGSAAGPPDVVCTTTFTGTAHDLTVPSGAQCVVTGATVTHDLVLQNFAGADISGTSVGHDVRFGDEAGAGVTDSSIGHDLVAGGEDSGADVRRTTIGHDLLAPSPHSGFGTEGVRVGHDFVASGEESGADLAGTTIDHDVKLIGLGGDLHMERTNIGHDLFASKPQTVQTGRNGPDTPGGPVNVGNDFTIDGSPGPDFPFVFDGMCNLNVVRDLTMTNRSVTLGTGLGGNCAGIGEPGDTVGRDLIFTGNHSLNGFFGPSSLQLVANHVGRDLVFSNNTAVPGGSLEVSGNTVARDATCAANNPAVTVSKPNIAGRTNTCG